MARAIPMGWPQRPSHQLCLWLFLWGGPSLPFTGYVYGYSDGVASELSPSLLGAHLRWISPGCLLLFPWGGPNIPATSFAHGYSYGVASKLVSSFLGAHLRWDLSS